MVLEILRHTPIWVWGLFAGLLALGLSQTRMRRVNPARLWLTPLALGLWGLWSLRGPFMALPLVGLAWALALWTSAHWVRGRGVPSGAQWVPQAPGGGQWQLPGSWLPLVFIVVIFAVRYVSAVSLVLHPEWQGRWQMQAPLALLLGSVSGLLLGRTWVLWDRRGTAVA